MSHYLEGKKKNHMKQLYLLDPICDLMQWAHHTEKLVEVREELWMEHLQDNTLRTEVWTSEP